MEGGQTPPPPVAPLISTLDSFTFRFHVGLTDESRVLRSSGVASITQWRHQKKKNKPNRYT